MRWLLRVAASAAIRRVVYLVIAALLGLLAMSGKAQAQDYTDCYGDGDGVYMCPNKQVAYEQALRVAELKHNNDPAYPIACVDTGWSAGRRYWACTYRSGSTRSAQRGYYADSACPAGSTWNEATKQCLNDVCQNAGVLQVVDAGAKGLLRCLQAGQNPDGSYQSCMFNAQTIAPGHSHAGYVGWVTTGQSCDPQNVQCPPGYARGVGTFDSDTCYPEKTCEVGEVDPITGECPAPDACPEGKEKAPDGTCRMAADNCPFGTTKAPDGSCVEDPGQCKPGTVKGDDGTCKNDADGDGEPDEGQENTATDSASCGSPPVCNGDQIMCLHAKQLWRIDCNTRRNANVILDKYCNAPPVCERVALGDDNRALGCTRQEEAGLYLQWRAVCEAEKANDALERIAENTKGGGGSCGAGTSDANCDGQPDWTEGAADGLAQAGLTDPGEDATPGDVVVEGEPIGAAGLDMTGFGYGSTCPTIPDVQINGQTISFDTSVFCNWLKLGGQFVLIAAALLSLSIMTRIQ